MTGRIAIYVCGIMLLLLCGCSLDKAKEQEMKWRLTFDRNDKRPYGTYLACQSLKYFFPSAKIEALPAGFRFGNMDNKMKYNNDGRSVIILEGLYFYLSDNEWKVLKDFIGRGNEVVIFSSGLDDKIEQELGCHKQKRNEERQVYYDSIPRRENQDILSIGTDHTRRYGYSGRSLTGYFRVDVVDSVSTNSGSTFTTSDIDTSSEAYYWYYPDTLGYANDSVNILRYGYGDGHLTLHAAPLALSNYFLLQPGNRDYLAAVWNTLPDDVNRVYWSDFYIREDRSSGLDILWRFPPAKWALLLAIFTLIVYLLFEGKRKQRIIPVVAPLRNDSVSFVETVGRLYFNKGNHANLAEKMTQQFLEWVRMHYFLNTNLLNDDFTRQLIIKSGQPETSVHGLIEMIHEIKLRSANVDDAYLYQLYNTIQKFYKNHQ